MLPRTSPVHPSFGVEVSALDVTSLTPAARTYLNEALRDRLLLILRKQSLSFDEQVALTAVFGEVDDRILPSDRPFRDPDDPRIQVVSNDPAGPTLATATTFWHIDQSFRPSPSPVIILKAVVLPSGGGGETMFADMRAAYDALPATRKAALAGLTARHRFGAALGMADFTTAPGGGAIHPLVRTHPNTKRQSLYLNQLCMDSIEGMPQRDAADLLGGVYADALRPEFVYSHRWRPGDVLVWDNHSLMHRLVDVPAARRVLHRTHTRG